MPSAIAAFLPPSSRLALSTISSFSLGRTFEERHLAGSALGAGCEIAVGSADFGVRSYCWKGISRPEAGETVFAKTRFSSNSALPCPLSRR
jgi:hypothetical protein